MHQPSSELVWGKDGLRGTLLQPSDISQVEIRLDNGQQLLVPTEMLVRQQDGSCYLSLSPPEVEQFGRRDADSSETLVVPVIVEELEVQKRIVETGKVRADSRDGKGPHHQGRA